MDGGVSAATRQVRGHPAALAAAPRADTQYARCWLGRHRWRAPEPHPMRIKTLTGRISRRALTVGAQR